MLDDKERATFCAIADYLIPAYEDMPAFSQADTQGVHTDRVLDLRPELQDSLTAALALVPPIDAISEVAEHLNREQPEIIGLIGLVASSAYYLNPDVRRRLGYPGQVQRPPGDDEAYDYEDLLQPVIDRGPIFRPV